VPVAAVLRDVFDEVREPIEELDLLPWSRVRVRELGCHHRALIAESAAPVSDAKRDDRERIRSGWGSPAGRGLAIQAPHQQPLERRRSRGRRRCVGVHFPAWEQPQLFAQEVRAGFRSLRSESDAGVPARGAGEVEPKHPQPSPW